LTRLLCGRGGRDGARGQGLVEFALMVPVILLILLGMLEFGFAFTHEQTIAYATREGARAGSALGGGSTSYPCATSDFDAPIVAAVERVLTSNGSPIAMDQVSEIDVYLAKADGTQTSGKVNQWLPAPGGGPVIDGKNLDFHATNNAWTPCARNNGVNADGLGVSITYNYRFVTPLGGIMKVLGGSAWSSLPITDKTIMNLNPTN
jgi:TadE-like protein